MRITIEGIKNCNLDKYEKLKDEAIKSIGKRKEEKDESKLEIKKLKRMFGKLKPPINTRKQIWEQLGVNRMTFYRWIKEDDSTKSLGIQGSNVT